MVSMDLSVSVSKLQFTALRNMLDLDFDLLRSLQVKANGTIWKSFYDFLFNFNGYYAPICKRFQVTTLWNMRDLDFDLSRSL